MDVNDTGHRPLQPMSLNQQPILSLAPTRGELVKESSSSSSSSTSIISATQTAIAAAAASASVHDRISQFNTLAMQSRQLERKTADAALKRAMLGREEAETEMRRYRDEARALRRQVDEGRERERKVGERLETVMENFGRAKETHAHTQALWEKEIRRSRKEIFKAQSSSVKLQEELKSARATVKLTEEALGREQDRGRTREQEAFSARYEMAGMQEQLGQALERAKAAEAERDTFRTIAAQSEEVARIAAEDRHSREEDPERGNHHHHHHHHHHLHPHSGADADDAGDDTAVLATPLSDPDNMDSFSTSDAATADELDQARLLLEWERKRADRALEMVDFLEAECRFQMCLGAKIPPRRGSLASPRRRTSRTAVEIADSSDLAILREGRERVRGTPAGLALREIMMAEDGTMPEGKGGVAERQQPMLLSLPAAAKPKPRRDDGRRSTIFCPREGIFRTVSQQEADEIYGRDQEAREARDARERTEESRGPAPGAGARLPTPPATDSDPDPRVYARTPSLDPPAFAVMAKERISLQSLLNAPHDAQTLRALPSIPTVPDGGEYGNARPPRSHHPYSRPLTAESVPEVEENGTREQDARSEPNGESESGAYDDRPHTSTACYLTTTTQVPLRSENAPTTAGMVSGFGACGLQRTPSSGSAASFDASNPAMTPTMTREEALAQIRERRGRARSAAAGNLTPHRKMIQGVGETGRNVSAPAGGGGDRSVGSGKMRV